MEILLTFTIFVDTVYGGGGSLLIILSEGTSITSSELLLRFDYYCYVFSRKQTVPLKPGSFIILAV